MPKRLIRIVLAGMMAMIQSGCAAQEESVSTPAHTEHQYTNHLMDENSPYLLSHAHNPVDWYPWGEEALAAAREQDKPIFLSIGYAACHWCHVMERESFENETVAAILNDHYIGIKVDREQRPDLDQIYMAFTTALTGSGGWPMSVFLTPDLKPFFAGTYFPREDAYGRPGFKRLITEIATTYREDRERVVQSAEGIYGELSRRLTVDRTSSPVTGQLLEKGASDLMRTFDQVDGGFGSQPKFPHALELSLFLRQHRATGQTDYLEAAALALTKMARGGIYDHLGGGFARYSTDRRWLVPHFEKMLYDNSLLVPVYVSAWQLTGDSLYLGVVRQTLDWLLREMTNFDGAFYSALDADSEGEEGKFYVWSQSEIESVLGDDAELFMRYYNVTEGGNFEGHNILNVTAGSQKQRADSNADRFDERLNEMRGKLLHRRDERIRPLTDDKILASWNGLALTALCRGYQATADNRYVEAAIMNAEFVTGTLWRDGKLTHSYREGRGSSGEFLEDYAFYTRGLIDLYESDPGREHEHWLDMARELADRALELFQDDQGIFYLRPDGQSDLIMRPRDEVDGAIPAPGSIMIGNLLKLNRLTGDKRYLDQAELALQAISGQLGNNPSSMTSALLAIDYYLSDKLEFVIVGGVEKRREMIRALYGSYLPNRVIAISDDGDSGLPLFEGRRSQDGLARAYVCRNSVCGLPAETIAQFTDQLKDL